MLFIWVGGVMPGRIPGVCLVRLANKGHRIEDGTRVDGFPPWPRSSNELNVREMVYLLSEGPVKPPSRLKTLAFWLRRGTSQAGDGTASIQGTCQTPVPGFCLRI